ncbi:Toll-Interleukin receptor domain-containing protein [Cavenderia fasciculata]|uniref:Toll-Interleukin receptor domain-containing protein n=1 Tax=Cavenderia fasciculata TaxID=261658 RepID=F4Q6I5_CACFS|nr:Toll-Interleukin receptor domain-containing protein [Cavenderia fasciculata]EGG16495.1 Toll-Interleukin receptor domain-containing protein [Cavenderia fasciculata]|eukprot:XP_004354895.1 Toll-Interleukin receptor domain-containing protein [Cavenderia fasciculata]
MILQDKKFYLVTRSSGLTWQSKSTIKKILEDNGASIGFSIIAKSTDYVVIISDSVNANKKKPTIAAPNPSLYSIYTKAKKCNVPVVTDDFIFKCIVQSTLLDHSLFVVDNVLENGIVMEKNHLQDVLGMDFSGFDDDKLDDDESVYSEFMMDDLLTGWDEQQSSSSSTPSEEDSSTFEQLDLEKQWIEFDEEKENTEMFNIEYPHDKEHIIQENYLKPIQEINGYAYYYDEGTKVLTFIGLPSQLKKININHGGFTTFIDNKKNLYAWGKFTPNISYGSIRKLLAIEDGPESDEDDLPFGREVRFNQVASCHRNFVSIDEKGSVWYLDTKKQSYSEEEHERYNLPSRSYRMLTRLPQHIGSNYRAVSVSCGYDFCAMLLSNQRVVTWGRNNVGQLGRKASSIHHNPPGLVQLENITSISCGDQHTMVISSSTTASNRDIYSWGKNDSRQLGVKLLSFTSTPQKVYSQHNLELKVFCSSDYSIIMQEPNTLILHTTKRTFPKEFQLLGEMDIKDYELFNCNKYLGIRLVGAYQNAKGLVYNNKVDLLKSYLDEKEHTISVTQICSLIHTAVRFDHLEAFKLLFARYPSSRIEYNTNSTVIHTCAQYNSIKVLRYILRNRLENLNTVELTEGSTALHIACEKNYFDSALLLLEFGCDRNVKNTKGSTPFHFAVKNYPVGVLMAQKGAQNIPDRSMKTPLQYAVGEEKAFLQSLLFTNEIFLSYAHKDSVFVKDLRLSLEESSLRCWLDEYRLQAGCNWRSEITKGVQGSNVVLFTISPTSINSLWCRKELKMAKRLCKPVVALYYFNLDIDPVLHGLFDYEIRFADNKAWADLDAPQRRVELERVGKIVKSIDNRTPCNAKNQFDKVDTYNKFADRSIYISFTEADHSLEWLTKEGLLTRSLPLTDRDEIQDGGASRLVKLEQERSKKKKEEKEQKQKQKLHLVEQQKKKLEKQHQQFLANSSANDAANDDQSLKEQVEQIDEVARANYYRNLYSFSEESFEQIHVQEFHTEDHSNTAEDPEKEIAHLKQYINNSILHLVIYTDKTNDSLEEIIQEVKYSLGQSKTIYIVTNNYSQNFTKCQNETIKSLPWVEIQYQLEEEFYDKIVSVYEVIEKTFTTMAKINHLVLEKERNKL